MNDPSTELRLDEQEAVFGVDDESPLAGDPTVHQPGEPRPVAQVLLDNGIGSSELVDIAAGRRGIGLGEAGRRRLDAARRVLLEALGDGGRIYGASSGIGDLRVHQIDDVDRDRLQMNVVRSHCCGVGEPLPADIVRGAMATRAATFVRGHSGVRPRLVELLMEMTNRGVVPLVPAHGSVGASGDLVLQAHIALVMIGEGQAWVPDGRLLPGEEALRAVGLEALSLRPREGLAMVNGLDFTISVTALAVPQARRLLEWADGVAALGLDVMQGSLEPFFEQVQYVRGTGAHRVVARRVRALCAGSGLIATDGPEEGPHDPYCLRCVPQVHGASWEVLETTEQILQRELSATIDNPLIFAAEPAIYHCGHFHGQALAMAADNLAVALVNIANISQTRISLLLRGARGLPPVLCEHPGVEHGPLMLETSAASLLARCRAEAAPISVHSIPVSPQQEDHVSMSWEAVRRTEQLIPRIGNVVAMEAAAAMAAARLRGPQKLGIGTREIFEQLDAVAPPLNGDWPLDGWIVGISELLGSGDCPGNNGNG